MNNNAEVIKLVDVSKIYDTGSVKIEALRGISLTVKQGEFVALMGPSGSGKSTCLNILGCLDQCTSGTYLLDLIETNRMNDDQLAKIRNKKLGFVFQMFNLLPRMTAVKNVELPLLYAGVRHRQHLSETALASVGLVNRLHHRPNELSGGEQQRVAIARAIVNQPEIILADEPTGNLDSRAGHEIMKIFEILNQQGITIVMVTHDQDIARYAHRIIRFKDGRIE